MWNHIFVCLRVHATPAHATPTHPPTRGFYGHIRLQNSSCSEAGIVINHEGIAHYGTTTHSKSGGFLFIYVGATRGDMKLSYSKEQLDLLIPFLFQPVLLACPCTITLAFPLFNLCYFCNINFFALVKVMCKIQAN